MRLHQNCQAFTCTSSRAWNGPQAWLGSSPDSVIQQAAFDCRSSTVVHHQDAYALPCFNRTVKSLSLFGLLRYLHKTQRHLVPRHQTRQATSSTKCSTSDIHAHHPRHHSIKTSCKFHTPFETGIDSKHTGPPLGLHRESERYTRIQYQSRDIQRVRADIAIHPTRGITRGN